jgi:hypothetical protein
MLMDGLGVSKSGDRCWTNRLEEVREILEQTQAKIAVYEEDLDSRPLRSRLYFIKNTMLRQQSINSRRANGFVPIVLGIIGKLGSDQASEI